MTAPPLPSSIRAVNTRRRQEYVLSTSERGPVVHGQTSHLDIHQLPEIPYYCTIMTSVEDQVRQAASRNAELLHVLAQTDYAIPTMQQQDSYIGQVEHAVAVNNTELKKLAATRERELKDHESYSQSVTRRFLYKASGQKEKFVAKAEKEEKEYFEALRAEHHAQQEAQSLATQLHEAQTRKSELQPDVARHQQAQNDLDSLYQSIFAGPTPSFPQEDQQERAVQAALSDYQQRERELRAEEQVLGLLDKASNAMANAQYHVNDALRYSRRDMFGGGTITDMMERSALSNAEVATAQLLQVMQQASSISPYVQPLPQIPIAQGSLMSDVLFDNIFTDMAFHEKISESAMSLQRAAGILQQNHASAQQRRGDLSGQMGHASQVLADERQKLQKVRERIFEESAHQGNRGQRWDAPPATHESTNNGPPPAYS